MSTQAEKKKLQEKFLKDTGLYTLKEVFKETKSFTKDVLIKDIIEFSKKNNLKADEIAYLKYVNKLLSYEEYRVICDSLDVMPILSLELKEQLKNVHKIKINYERFYKETKEPFINGKNGDQYIEPYCGLDFSYNPIRRQIHKDAPTCALCPLIKKAYKHLETILEPESYKELKDYVEKTKLFDVSNKERHNIETQNREMICARWMIFHTMHEVNYEMNKQGISMYWDAIKFICEPEEIKYE